MYNAQLIFNIFNFIEDDNHYQVIFLFCGVQIVQTF